VLTNGPEGSLLIVKGAPEGVLPLCTKRMDGTATPPMESQQRADVSVQIHNLAGDGLRCIAVASRPWSGPTHDVDATDEADLVFEGLCAFADPPKPSPASQKRESGSRSSPATTPSS
jgi:Mg2+-importing ATPase